MKTTEILELELIMTNAAFGFEYALISLQDAGELNFQATKIQNELEQHRKVYFSARSQLTHLNQQHVEKLEDQLRQQKSILFHRQAYLQ